METLPQTEPSRHERFIALTELVAAPLHRYALRRIDADTAEDVVADALLVLWRRLDDVPIDDPLPWSYAVARGCLANARRAKHRQVRLIDRLTRQQEQATDPPAFDDAPLDAALAHLSETDRELIRLWAWERLAPREIALAVGISANAVSIRLHRARKQLAILLAPQGEGPRKNPPIDGQKQANERRRP